VATKTEGEREFRIRPRRSRTARENEAFPWSPGMRTVVRYARGSRRRYKRRSHNGSGGGRRQVNQRCVVRVMYSPNRTNGQWRANGATSPATVQRKATKPALLATRAKSLCRRKVLDRWQKAGDPRLWKMIISPEFGDGLLNDFNLRAEQLRPPGGGEGGQIRRDVCLACRRLLAEKALRRLAAIREVTREVVLSVEAPCEIYPRDECLTPNCEEGRIA